MKKFLKILAIVVLVLLIALAGAGFYIWRGVKAVPAFYQQQPLEGQDRLQAIESVERKVLNLQADLDRAYALSQATSQPAASDTPVDVGVESIAVVFSGPEIDTYFRKWLAEAGYAPRLQRYMENPRIGIENGRVILAGRMPEFDSVVSLHFLPVVDEQGGVQLRLDGVYAGRIRIPNAALDEFRSLSVNALGENLDQLRREADISPEGFANEAAILAASRAQLIELFRGEQLEPPITFVPIPGRGLVAARISDLSVDGHQLLLGIQLLDSPERARLLEQIRLGR